MTARELARRLELALAAAGSPARAEAAVELLDLRSELLDLVYEWLRPRARRAFGVTVREAVKHLPEDQRAEILEPRA